MLWNTERAPENPWHSVTYVVGIVVIGLRDLQTHPVDFFLPAVRPQEFRRRAGPSSVENCAGCSIAQRNDSKKPLMRVLKTPSVRLISSIFLME